MLPFKRPQDGDDKTTNGYENHRIYSELRQRSRCKNHCYNSCHKEWRNTSPIMNRLLWHPIIDDESFQLGQPKKLRWSLTKPPQLNSVSIEANLFRAQGKEEHQWITAPNHRNPLAHHENHPYPSGGPPLAYSSHQQLDHRQPCHLTGMERPRISELEAPVYTKDRGTFLSILEFLPDSRRYSICILEGHWFSGWLRRRTPPTSRPLKVILATTGEPIHHQSTTNKRTFSTPRPHIQRPAVNAGTPWSNPTPTLHLFTNKTTQQTIS